MIRRKLADEPEWAKGLPLHVLNKLAHAGYKSDDQIIEGIVSGKIKGRRQRGKRGTIGGIGIKTIKLLVQHFQIEIPKKPRRRASQKTLNDAIVLLERYGYRIIPPED